MNSCSWTLVLAFVAAVCIENAFAFTSSHKSSIPFSPTALSMAPRFDKTEQRWYATKPEEEDGSSYGPVGSLIRAGPKPFLQRIITPDMYDQAVLKYMASEGCDRKEAQGNMDAYLENAQDWTYQKLQEKKGKPKYDYANANTSPKQLALSGAWASVVVWFFYTFITDCINGVYAR